MRIVCVGGGPAALYFAISAKRRDAGHEITVLEKDPRGATYGWGVVCHDALLDRDGGRPGGRRQSWCRGAAGIGLIRLALTEAAAGGAPGAAMTGTGEDADVDALKEQIFRELLTYMMEDPKTIPRAIRLILVSRFLERVADHATNIAEMVVYMVESKMVRHMLA